MVRAWLSFYSFGLLFGLLVRLAVLLVGVFALRVNGRMGGLLRRSAPPLCVHWCAAAQPKAEPLPHERADRCSTLVRSAAASTAESTPTGPCR